MPKFNVSAPQGPSNTYDNVVQDTEYAFCRFLVSKQPLLCCCKFSLHVYRQASNPPDDYSEPQDSLSGGGMQQHDEYSQPQDSVFVHVAQEYSQPQDTVRPQSSFAPQYAASCFLLLSCFLFLWGQNNKELTLALSETTRIRNCSNHRKTTTCSFPQTKSSVDLKSL